MVACLAWVAVVACTGDDFERTGDDAGSAQLGTQRASATGAALDAAIDELGDAGELVTEPEGTPIDGGMEAVEQDAALPNTQSVDAGDPGPEANLDAAVEQRPDDSIASELDEALLAIPCAAPPPPNSNHCSMTHESEVQSQRFTLQGDPDTVYAITLAVRGVLEVAPYVGGEALSDHLYNGGGLDEEHRGWHAVELSFSEPDQSYFLNRAVGARGTAISLVYDARFEARGGSDVTLRLNAANALPDTIQGINLDNLELLGVSGIEQPYDGQFVQLQVLSVEEIDTTN